MQLVKPLNNVVIKQNSQIYDLETEHSGHLQISTFNFIKKKNPIRINKHKIRTVQDMVG